MIYNDYLFPGYGHAIANGGHEWWAYDLYNLGYVTSFNVYQCPTFVPHARFQKRACQRSSLWALAVVLTLQPILPTGTLRGARFSDGGERSYTFFKTGPGLAKVSLLMDGFKSVDYSGKWTVDPRLQYRRRSSSRRWLFSWRRFKHFIW